MIKIGDFLGSGQIQEYTDRSAFERVGRIYAIRRLRDSRTDTVIENTTGFSIPLYSEYGQDQPVLSGILQLFTESPDIRVYTNKRNMIYIFGDCDKAISLMQLDKLIDASFAERMLHDLHRQEFLTRGNGDGRGVV